MGTAPALDDEVAKKVSDLKSQGNKMFAQKDWAKAIEQYESAMKMLPAGHAERGDLLCNKAACLMGLNRYKDAVKECGSALEAVPNSAKALRSRAKALEKQGLYKQALADIQAVNRTESANDDSREAEKRLKDLMAGRRPSLANGGARAAANTAANAAANRGARSPAQWPFSAKVTLGSETRLVQLTASAGYGDLLAQVAAKFPTAGPVVLRYLDAEGDLVTITSRNDLHAAFAEALKNADKRLGVAGIPPIKVQATAVANHAEVPPIPVEELNENRTLQQQILAQQAAQQLQQQTKQTAQGYPSGDLIEIDDWLIDLIGMVKDAAGIDSDKHIDVQNDAMTVLGKAIDTTIRSEEAQPLFDKAAARFQEIIAMGYVQWSQVHTHKAHRLMDVAALADQSWSKELEGSVKKEFDAAEALIKKSLDVKADYFEALGAMAALECDRAKVACKLLQKPVPPMEPAADEAAVKASQEATTAATKEALAKIKAGDVKSAGKNMTNAAGWYKKARAAAEAADAERKAEAEKRKGSSSSSEDKQPEAAAAANGQAEGSQDSMLTTLSSHAQVMHGNSLYEWSQVLAAVDESSWKSVLDEATELFRAAGCAEKDIRGALKNHTEVDKLDLGPDPEPEPEPTPAPAAAAAEGPSTKQHKAAPEAKGLPKLERKPKEKAAATQ